MLFFLAVIGVAVVGGLGPALLAAGLSAALLNFFTEPRYSLTIAATPNVVTVVAMLLVGITVATRLLGKVGENFGLTSVVVLQRRDGRWDRVAASGPNPCAEPGEADTDIAVDEDVHLAVRGRPLDARDRAVLAAAGQAVLALRQQQAAEQAAQARRTAEATELRTALLSAVGHDLRTPLTSIKASVGSLRDVELRLCPADTAELLATIEESTDRLSAVVANLLDSSRLATGAVAPMLRSVGYDEVVGPGAVHHGRSRRRSDRGDR